MQLFECEFFIKKIEYQYDIELYYYNTKIVFHNTFELTQFILLTGKLD